jgi:hypothetical protein
VVTFLYGAAAMGFAVVGLYFLKFWTQSRDWLFLCFAVAFVLLAADRVVLALLPLASEFRELVFLMRLLAFCLILFGIYGKNRRQRS